MSAQPGSSGGPSRDYIVEYRAGQFQNGSLVLRFDTEPSEKQLREALIAHGLPAKALEEVRARPMHATRLRPVAHSSPQPQQPVMAEPVKPLRRKAPGCSGGQLILVLVVAAFGALTAFAEDAQQAGDAAGAGRTSETMVVGCWEDLGDARDLADPEAGLIGGLFAQAPTSFVVSPANTAFYFTCLGSASGG